MKKTRILIAGGTGFIGFHLAKACLRKNYEITSLSTKKPTKVRKLKNVKYLICDITKKNDLELKIKKSYDYVINLAGYVDHSKKKKTIRSHYNGCLNLANFFLKKKIKRFIQIGSSIEYGKIRSPQKENKLNFQKTYSAYGYSKLSSTKYLLNLYRKNNFPVTILRLYLIYGPFQDLNRIVPIAIFNCLKNKTFHCSPGTQFRDFLYVDDLVEAILKTLKIKKTIGEIINVGSGKPKKIRDLIKDIQSIIQKGKPIFGKIKLRNDEIEYLYPNISKIKKQVKWLPKTELTKGLKKTIKYYKNVR